LPIDIIPLIGGIMKPMPMSGKDMLKAYEEAGWKVLRQKGSHVQVGKDQLRETIPMHKELGKGFGT
jgi:predicted RNA binding protein YcfA (HicA-like mRNA interferase family)